MMVPAASEAQACQSGEAPANAEDVSKRSVHDRPATSIVVSHGTPTGRAGARRKITSPDSASVTVTPNPLVVAARNEASTRSPTR